jgi:hypothetical protein
VPVLGEVFEAPAVEADGSDGVGHGVEGWLGRNGYPEYIDMNEMFALS